MIDQRCLGPDLDRKKISPEAQVSGASYLTGRRTSVAAGAIVRDARLHDVVVESQAEVVDSIVVAEGRPKTHKCDAAGLTVVGGAELPTIATGAHVSGCTLINTSVGPDTQIRDTWAGDCELGGGNTIDKAKLVLVGTDRHVEVSGPTEVSEAYLGHHAVIDQRGYLEGKFSNVFPQLKFNEAVGRLEVVGTIDLPHVSRYGINTINSTNSGKLLPQPDGVLKGLGPQRGLWQDELLSHEQVELGPCCWVAPWTKVVGQSATPHQSIEEAVNDELMTYVMPFALAGFGGEATNGLVMPGELSNGYGPKSRKGAWVFTYAPDAVINMVRRLHEALPDEQKHVADTIVAEALTTAIEITKLIAARNKVDLSVPAAEQRPGWGRWVGTTYPLLVAHLAEGLWEFDGGQPVGWRMDGRRWTHPKIDRLLALAPDALENQVSEAEIFNCENPVPAASIAMPSGAANGTGGESQIEPGAKIARTAAIGPGCRIDADTVIESGAVVWNSVLAGCKVHPGARIERSDISSSEVGACTIIRSCRIANSSLGDSSTAQAAGIADSRIAPSATIAAFSDLVDVSTDYAAILGGTIHSVRIGTNLMSMHMAGACQHLAAIPTPVEVDGQQVSVPAVPMIGGGALIRGESDRPVVIESCFIGSNAIVEANTYVGFGCFILGVLGPDEGLLPFTLSTGGGASRHQIGAVLGSLASTIITHCLSWTYQAVEPQGAPAVGELVRQTIQRGIDAIEWELARRNGHAETLPEEEFACFRSLRHYDERQLSAGLNTYRRVLDSGAWEFAWDGEELTFSSPKGRWLERGGNAFWKKQ